MFNNEYIFNFFFIPFVKILVEILNPLQFYTIFHLTTIGTKFHCPFQPLTDITSKTVLIILFLFSSSDSKIFS